MWFVGFCVGCSLSVYGHGLYKRDVNWNSEILSEQILCRVSEQLENYLKGYQYTFYSTTHRGMGELNGETYRVCSSDSLAGNMYETEYFP